MILDLIALFVASCCILIYFIMILYGLKFPEKTKRGSLNLIYEKWVERRLLPEQNPIVAVQAMRNLIMANSIFISALLVLLGILVGFDDIIFSNGEFISGEVVLNLGQVQIVFIGLIIVFSLVNFVLAVRLIVRFTLLISMDPGSTIICGMDGTVFTKRTLTSAQNHWLLGLRGLFFLLPVLSWLINPLFCIIGVVIVTFYLIFFEDIFKFESNQKNNC